MVLHLLRRPPCHWRGLHSGAAGRQCRSDGPVSGAVRRRTASRRPRRARAVVQAAAPERLIRSGLPTEALVAHVLVSKYAWHLPLYRQAQILLAQGIVIEG